MNLFCGLKELAIAKDLFVQQILPSPQTVSDGAICLDKLHRLLHNILIINMDKFLQRGGILIRFERKNLPVCLVIF